MEEKRILLVEDDNSLRATLGMFLSKAGYKVNEARSAEEAMKHLERTIFDLVISDLKLYGKDGMYLLKHVRREFSETAFILISAYADIETAVQALKEGAADFIEKPFSPPSFIARCELALSNRSSSVAEGDKIEVSRPRQADFHFDHIIGRSYTVRKMKDMVRMVEELPKAVLLSGEGGVGKESLARQMHDNSARAGKPFVVISCSALTENLIEAELFGQKSGEGIFAQANGGTLFLDEVSALPQSLQVKLARLIETSRVRLVGQAEEATVDMRIICASTKDLEKMVAEDKFRQDLFYRISMVHLKLESLKTRVEDIPLLMEYFLQGFNRQYGKKIQGYSKGCLDLCMKYEWPGNIRELKNAIERSVIFCKENLIQALHLPESVREPQKHVVPSAVDLSGMTLRDVERAKIVEALKIFSGNKANTAKALGIGRNTLWRKLKEYKIED